MSECPSAECKIFDQLLTRLYHLLGGRDDRLRRGLIDSMGEALAALRNTRHGQKLPESEMPECPVFDMLNGQLFFSLGGTDVELRGRMTAGLTTTIAELRGRSCPRNAAGGAGEDSADDFFFQHLGQTLVWTMPGSRVHGQA